MSILDKFWEAGLINKPEDFTESIWYMPYDDRIVWNTEGNLEDLYNETGMTYCEPINTLDGELDNFVIYDVQDSCGGSRQCIFSLTKRVASPEED